MRLRPIEAPLRVLLTGGTGFLGSVVASILRRRHAVEGFSRSTGSDVLDLEALSAAAEGRDVVVHLAGLAEGPRHEVFRTNVQGTLNAAEAAARAGAALVFVSSAAACEPATAYGRSKRLAEDAVAWYADSGALDAAVLRVFNAYGPGSPGVVTRFLEDDPIVLHGDGGASRDFVHVDDVAEAVALCLRPEGLFRSDVGTGRATRLSELAAMVGKPAVHRTVPPDHPIRDSVARDVHIPGWRPRVSLADWVREHRRAVAGGAS